MIVIVAYMERGSRVGVVNKIGVFLLKHDNGKTPYRSDFSSTLQFFTK